MAIKVISRSIELKLVLKNVCIPLNLVQNGEKGSCCYRSGIRREKLRVFPPKNSLPTRPQNLKTESLKLHTNSITKSFKNVILDKILRRHSNMFCRISINWNSFELEWLPETHYGYNCLKKVVYVFRNSFRLLFWVKCQIYN